MDISSLKEEGNAKFKEGHYEEALSAYTQALDLGDIKDNDKAVIYKNRAMCHLKLDEYKEAAEEASKCLEIFPCDPKALYRRCVAYESLGKFEDAYKDAAMLIKVDPKNSSVKPILTRLTPIMKEKAKQQSSSQVKVQQMFNLIFDSTVDREKRVQAANNLIVLAREGGGPEVILNEGGMAKLKDVLTSEKDMEIVTGCVRTLACMANNHKDRSKLIYEEIGLTRVGQLISLPVESLSTAVGLLLQNMADSITEIRVYRDLREKYDEKRRNRDPCIPPKFIMDEYQQKFLDEMFNGLIKVLQHIKASACGRDTAMELIIKNVTVQKGFHWTNKFLYTEGIEACLMICGALKQHETLPVTDLSKMHASLLLNTVWEDLVGEKQCDRFKEKVSDFFKELFSSEDWESKVEAVRAISMLLQGPFEVGNMILGFEGVSQIMLALAQSERVLHQKVAVEAIVHSASKKTKCSGMLADAVPVLKELYHSGLDDSIKVRALVGLCKLGSFEGSDASKRPMADGSTVTLAKACRKFLTNPQGDLDMKQWGTEGLAYLTLDADVKEEIINDKATLIAIVEAAKNPKLSFMYTTATLFVNLTNSIDKQEMPPEMVELAKFSKQHVPEEHEKDKPEYVQARVKKLMEVGMVQAFGPLSKTESKNTREQISRVFLTVVTQEEYRGHVVQAGGVKILLNLTNESNTDLGKQCAAQALAKIAITQDPSITFNGQRMYEVVRPLITLLDVERSGLQNFEALLALTNLSSLSDSVRARIVSERGIPRIEQYLYEEHELIKRAAFECMCNMVMNERVAKTFEGDNDRVKLFTLMCCDEDEKLMRAAVGALAILSSSQKICEKITEVNKWDQYVMAATVSEVMDIQYRACFLLRNIAATSKEVAEKLFSTQLLEVLMAISILEAPDKQNARQCATEALEHGAEFGVVKRNKDDE